MESGRQCRASRFALSAVRLVDWDDVSAASRLRPAAVRHSVRGRGWRSSACPGHLLDTTTRATRACRIFPDIRSPRKHKTQPHFIEGDVPGGGTSGDRHLLIVDRDRWLLYEIFATRWTGSAGRWEAGSGAIFDLSTNARRPETWTSADAAGLAILPGLVRYDEVYGAEEISTPSASRRARRTITSGRHRIVRDRRSTHRRWARGCG